MSEDESQLKQLSVAFYVVGGFMVVFALIPLIHLGMGIYIATRGPELRQADGFESPLFGYLFVGVGLFGFLIGQTVATCMILTGRFLSARKNYRFCFVVACVACAFPPVGTVLGVFTIIVLSRERVKPLFA